MNTHLQDSLLTTISSGIAVSMNDIASAFGNIDALGRRVDRTVLMAAAFADNDGLIKALIDHGANVNVASRDGMTALHEAAGMGRTDAIKALVYFGASIEAENRFGETALMLAAAHGHSASVKALLELGADREHRSGAGATAADIAESKEEYDVVAILKAAK